MAQDFWHWYHLSSDKNVEQICNNVTHKMICSLQLNFNYNHPQTLFDWGMVVVKPYTEKNVNIRAVIYENTTKTFKSQNLI